MIFTKGSPFVHYTDGRGFSWMLVFSSAGIVTELLGWPLYYSFWPTLCPHPRATQCWIPVLLPICEQVTSGGGHLCLWRAMGARCMCDCSRFIQMFSYCQSQSFIFLRILLHFARHIDRGQHLFNCPVCRAKLAEVATDHICTCEPPCRKISQRPRLKQWPRQWICRKLQSCTDLICNPLPLATKPASQSNPCCSGQDTERTDTVLSSSTPSLLSPHPATCLAYVPRAIFILEELGSLDSSFL